MLREAENKVRIEGILSEIDLKYGSFSKNGRNMESIGGVVKIKVNQQINGEDKVLEIPVHMFAPKNKNDGGINPAYESIEKIKNDFVSIAAAGGEDGADRVRITSGKIQMNEYYSPDGRLISFPRITSSFLSKVKKDEFNPEATFSIEMVVAEKGYEVDSQGVETDRFKIKSIIPQYGGKVDIMEFIGLSKSVIDAVDQYWNKGDTVKALGKLNFSSKTETVIQEVDFGEPQKTTRTVSISELVITGGSSTPLEGDFAFDINEINSAVAERKARLEEQKERDMTRGRKRSAPAQDSEKGILDIGF